MALEEVRIRLRTLRRHSSARVVTMSLYTVLVLAGS